MKKLIYLLLFSSFLSLTAQNEATTNQVQTRNGIVYKNNLPFTGVLYGGSENTNNECKCTLKAYYTNGYINGSKKEYYSNGSIKFSGGFTNGKEQGEHIFYDSNGNVTSKEKYSNGEKQNYVNLNPLNLEEALFYLLFINEPDSYDEQFLRYYLYKFDSDFQNYKRNEFELKRKIENIKPIIMNRVKNVNFNTVYISSGNTPLSKYSFDTNNFKLNLRFDRPFNDYSVDFFRDSKMYSNNMRIGLHAPDFMFDNPNSFLSIDLPPNKAESFKNSLTHNTLYYTYEYKILPNVIKDKRYNIITGISAYILKVVFYSDKSLSTPIYTIDKSNDYNTTKLNDHKENSAILKNQNNSQIKQSLIEKTTTQFDILEKAAKEGNAESQFKLANMYFEGKEIPKDDTFAYYWYQQSAQNGNVSAQEAFGAIYFQLKKYQEAFMWYSKAAQSNHSRAQYVLGYMYLNGLGTKKSRRDAKSWWKKSCILGYANSCDEIKKMNAFGNALLNSVNESLNKGN